MHTSMCEFPSIPNRKKSDLNINKLPYLHIDSHVEHARLTEQTRSNGVVRVEHIEEWIGVLHGGNDKHINIGLSGQIESDEHSELYHKFLYALPGICRSG